MSFSGQVALVTGAGSPHGIGFATAALLASQGAKVAVTSTTNRIQERALELSANGADTFAMAVDLRKWNSVRSLVAETINRFGRLDVLVNNAGMTQTGQSTPASDRLQDLSEEDWDYGIEINLKTCFHVTKAALPAMLKQKYGRIINVSSTTGPVVSNPRETAYSAAKAAMVGLTRSLALEVARSGVTVNAVAPGWIETASSTPAEIVAGKNTPVGRAGTPAEVAAAIVFLASKSASYVTGQMLVIDGGNSIQEYKGPPDLYY